MKKVFVVAIVFAFGFSLNKTETLKAFQKIKTNVPEPSDIAYSPDFSSFFIVSDQGMLYQTDTLGKILPKKTDDASMKKKWSLFTNTENQKVAKVKGLDFEGVYADDKNVYIADERARRVLIYSQDSLKLIGQNEIPYSGGMNAGYEGIAYNKKKKRYVLVIEKNPIWLFELNSDLVKVNEVKVKMASDISSIYYYNDFMYVLSDEDQTVFKLDPDNYTVLKKWKIAVTNPEGMAFDKAGNLVIVSDSDQTIFKFKLTDN